VSIEDDIAFLERIPTLRLLGRTALRILAIGAESRYVHHGEILFTEGETADCAYVIQEGSFTVRSDALRGSEAELIAESGTLLGELAMLTETRRPATATAREPSTVIRISRSLFLKMLEGYPEAAVQMRAQIAARTRESISDVARLRKRFDAGGEPGGGAA